MSSEASKSGVQDAMPPSPFVLKSALRKSTLRTLKALPEVELEQQSRAVTKLLLDQPFFRNARFVGCYLSMAKGELRTDGIVNELLLRDIKLYTPCLPSTASAGPSSHSPTFLSSAAEHQADMRMLRLYSGNDLESCPLDKWGIIDPGETRRDFDEEVKREDVMNDGVDALDLILVPGVAFDEKCNRLGRGKAYYDRFLLSYTSHRPRPLLVALALTPQLMPPGELIPTTETDFRLDAVLSPSGIQWREGMKTKRRI